MPEKIKPGSQQHSPPSGRADAMGTAILSLLVAAGENNVIGKNNQLPWHLPNDLKYFKNQTWGMPILWVEKHLNPSANRCLEEKAL